MAKKSQPSKGQTVKRDQSRPKGTIGDSKKSMENLERRAAEIPPKTGSGSSKKNK